MIIRTKECYFWATHQDAELDIFIPYHGKRMGFKFKYSDHPKITKSMRIALSELSLDHLYIISPLKEHYALDSKITVTNLEDLKINIGWAA